MGDWLLKLVTGTAAAQSASRRNRSWFLRRSLRSKFLVTCTVYSRVQLRTARSEFSRSVFRKQSPEPDYAALRHELQTNKYVTLQLLLEEYRNQHPEGYRYSRRFCDSYRSSLRRQEVALRQEHRAGERLFVDYADAAVPIHNPESGQVGRRRSSSPCWAPAVTPTPRRI